MPIIEWDEKVGGPVPGELVSNWKMGNWSGNEHAELRTLRSGMCSIKKNGKEYLIYGWFSSVTPNSMARVFQAYQCDYAMHMDMNALEHTYMARYITKKGETGRFPEQLVTGMTVLDQRFEGNVPRFIGYPDNRDFFYLLQKSP